MADYNALSRSVEDAATMPAARAWVHAAVEALKEEQWERVEECLVAAIAFGIDERTKHA
jgi:hypothetical protein